MSSSNISGINFSTVVNSKLITIDTLAQFVQQTNIGTTSNIFIPFRMKANGTWAPNGANWYRGYVTYQNAYNQTTYSVDGHVIISQSSGYPTYIGYISGHIGIGFTVTWTEISISTHTHDNRYYTETEVTNLLRTRASTKNGIIAGIYVTIILKPTGLTSGGQVMVLVSLADEVMLLTIAMTNLSSTPTNTGVYSTILLYGTDRKFDTSSSNRMVSMDGSNLRIRIRLKETTSNMVANVVVFNQGYSVENVYGTTS